MLDVMASLLTYQAGLYLNGGGRPARRGNEHPSIVPYEVFKAPDAYLTLGVANNSLWERCCAALERAGPRQGPALRHRGHARDRTARRWFRCSTRSSARGPADDWLKRFEGGRAGRAHRTVAEVCESEHLKARGMIVSLPHPEGGRGHDDGRADPPARHARRGDARRRRCSASTPTRS